MQFTTLHRCSVVSNVHHYFLGSTRCTKGRIICRLKSGSTSNVTTTYTRVCNGCIKLMIVLTHVNVSGIAYFLTSIQVIFRHPQRDKKKSVRHPNGVLSNGLQFVRNVILEAGVEWASLVQLRGWHGGMGYTCPLEFVKLWIYTGSYECPCFSGLE